MGRYIHVAGINLRPCVLKHKYHAIGTTDVHGSVFGLFWGSCQLSLFFFGAVRPKGSIDPPLPQVKVRLPLYSMIQTDENPRLSYAEFQQVFGEGVPSHVPPVPSIEHWKRDQYCPVAGGNFRKSVPTCMRYASVRRLEVFENPWKDARKFWQPDRVPKRNRYR